MKFMMDDKFGISYRKSGSDWIVYLDGLDEPIRKFVNCDGVEEEFVREIGRLEREIFLDEFEVKEEDLGEMFREWIRLGLWKRSLVK